MSLEEIRFAAAVYAEQQREVTVTTKPGEHGGHTVTTGTCTFAGDNKFRVDTPLAAIFFEYTEVYDLSA